MNSESLSGGRIETIKKSPWFNVKIISAAVILVAAVAFLINNAMGGSAAYYMTVDELAASSSDVQGQQIRVAGDVADGSVQRGDLGDPIRFEVTDGNATIPMVYDGTVPDIFSDHAEVIATGTMRSDGVFEATELLTKCPSRFESKEGVSD